MKAQIYKYSSWINETDPKALYDLFSALLVDSGFHVEGFMDKHFNPQGYTGLFLISESHFAIHTFPEHNETYIELSSCTREPFDKFIKSM